MPRSTSPTLTEAELRLMKVLWERGSSTTGEVMTALAEEEIHLAESTVRTILGILKDKGYVGSVPRGRAQLYEPVVSRGEARRRALRHLLTRFFDDSREELVLNLLKDEEVDQEELARLKRMIREEE